MKTIACLGLCLMVSCTTIKPVTRAGLIGEWRYADNVKSCHYFFDPDGKFHGEVTFQGKIVSRFAGRWSAQGDTLFYHYTSDALHRIPAGATDQDRLIKVTANRFTIEAADGSKREYRRVH